MSDFIRLFDAVASERRDASAVVARDATLSFLALRSEAQQLAEELRVAGVREGDVVALSLRRTSLHVAGMLATWYAGAAFLPVDPAAPDDRVRALLDESRARVLVVEDGARAAIRSPRDGLDTARRRGGTPRLRHLHVRLDGAPGKACVLGIAGSARCSSSRFAPSGSPPASVPFSLSRPPSTRRSPTSARLSFPVPRWSSRRSHRCRPSSPNDCAPTRSPTRTCHRRFCRSSIQRRSPRP